jgi:hypothetical protein
VFVKVADGPGVGAVQRRNVPRIVRTKQGAVIRMPLLVRRGVGAARGMGAASLFTRPAPDGNPGTEIVDISGNVVYTWQQVAANPGLIAQLGQSSGCQNGTLPVWFPGNAATGGGPVCADPSAVVPGEGNSPFAQFEYPINGQCNPGVWCFTGSNLNDPNSYTWTGGGNPDVMNPAYVRNAGTPYPAPQNPGMPYQLPFQPTVLTDPTPTHTPPVFVARDPVPPVIAPPPLRPATAAILNTSRPGQPFQVGDSWKLVVTGTSNQPVSGTASQDGQSLGTTPYGSTDANGQLVLTGSMDASTVGNWSELWTVGTVSAPVLTFSVSAAPGQPPPSGGGGGANNQTTGAPSTAGIADFFTQSVTIGGMSFPVWGIAAAAVGGLFLLSGGSRR